MLKTGLWTLMCTGVVGWTALGGPLREKVGGMEMVRPGALPASGGGG